jgi:lipopolysaccharide export system protein LptA
MTARISFLAALVLVTASMPLLAQSPKGNDKAGAKSEEKLPNAFQGFSRDTDQPVTIDADSLEIHDKDRYAVFLGNVIVKQGDSVMRSRELKVHYEGSMRAGQPGGEKDQKAAADSAKSRAGQAVGNDPAQRIRMIEATGGVIVTNKDQKATGDKGVFDMRTNLATISGNVVISQGPNVMRAEKLVVDMKTGFSRMEAGTKGGGPQRVQGLFVPSSVDTKKSQQK